MDVSRQQGLSCPRRVFASDALNVESHTMVRILGCVVAVTPWHHEEQSEKASFTILVLDDGTDMVRAACPCEMIAKLKFPPNTSLLGKTLDCVGKVVDTEQAEKFLMAETVVLVRDVHAETLRWLEICLQAKNSQGTRGGDTRYFMAGGYQPPSACTEDVSRFVQLGASGGGVTMEDLALVCGVEQDAMRAMVQELQMNGEIYQTRQGTYMPL